MFIAPEFMLPDMLPVCWLMLPVCWLMLPVCCLYIDWCWIPLVLHVVSRCHACHPWIYWYLSLSLFLFFSMFCRHFSINLYVLIPLFYKFLSSYLTFPCSAPTFLLSSCYLSPVPLCVNVMCVFVLSLDKWIHIEIVEIHIFNKGCQVFYCLLWYLLTVRLPLFSKHYTMFLHSYNVYAHLRMLRL